MESGGEMAESRDISVIVPIFIRGLLAANPEKVSSRAAAPAREIRLCILTSSEK